MNNRDPNIDDEIRHARAFLFLLTTAFFMLVVFLVLLFTLSARATQKSKCPAYGTYVEKSNPNV